MEDVIIVEEYHRIDRYNPVSGHRWTEYGNLKGYHVSGGWFSDSFHKTLKSAEIEMESRREINKKFPFTCPRTQREIDKARGLGLCS